MLFRRHKKSEEAQKALDEATKSLCEVKKRGFEVSKISNALKELNERNHFAEQMEEIIVRARGTLE